MARISLAFRCFFRLLFGRDLPREAGEFLPPGPPTPAALPDPRAAPEPKAAPKPVPSAVDARPERREPRTAHADLAGHHRDGALALLSLLQREGRLVDFLREGLDDFTDADIGAAVRDIHRGCRKVIEEHFVMEAVMPGEEEARVTVPVGFDPGEVRLVGKVSGQPPFKGTLRHHGWRVLEVKLPTLTDGVDRRVVAPAEVEIGTP
ncbi:MAG TPA: DUF2760 domain-containing protein [Kofleriaceae bacterium]|nr:DUF2760 domain-containing protein [Kofleriaceae bacterium]